MVFIKKQELQTYFQSLGFDVIEYSSVLRIHNKEKYGFIFFPSKRRYTKLYIYGMFYANKNLLLLPWRVEYHRFLFHTYLNRVISKNK